MPTSDTPPVTDNRRTGADRRKKAAAFPGPDRRVGPRRSTTVPQVDPA